MFKTKIIILKFYILFNDSQNVINNFYQKMNIFIDFPFEFLRKIVLFSFWYDKIYIYDCSYITFMIVPIINKNMITKYITLY